MATIDDTLKQLNSLSKDDWAKLFNLIPKIEETDSFGKMAGGDEISPGTVEMPYWDWSDITQSFVKTAYELKLVLNFDWGEWPEGKAILQNKSQDFDSLDLVTLCKLITTIIRADRFNDGYLISRFENGTVLNIIKAIKRNRENSTTPKHSEIQTNGLTDLQEKFIWLAYGEGKSYSDISKLLNVDRKVITAWESDSNAEEFIKLKKDVSAIRKTYTSKKIPQDFNVYKEWYFKMETDKKCEYCNITEVEINQLWEKDENLTKRNRGKKLELDRKQPNLEYDDLNNIVYACYWCNNAKTDTFTHEEFLEVGKIISKIWKQRLAK